MKHLPLLTLMVAALTFTACRSTGPKFDPRAAAGATNAFAGKPAEADDAAFAAVALTDRIQKEWLQPPKDLYRLGPGDIVEIESAGEGASTSTSVVGPDGKIYYALLPGVFVWGKTLTETRTALEEGLKKFLRAAPTLTVTLKTANSKNVWLLGSVTSPGVHSLATPMTLLEAITAAGGPVSTPGALDGVCDLQRSFLMRGGKLVPVDFEKLLRQGDLSQNLYLQPDDLIYLRSATVRSVSVMGAVGGGGMVPYSDGMTLLSSIVGAGGTAPYAYLSQVAIIRGSLSNPQIATVNLKDIMEGREQDVKLVPGDIVYVPFVPWRKIAMLAESMLDSFVRSVAANEGSRAVGGSTVNPVVPITPVRVVP